MSKPIAIVAGIGNAGGTGAATARLFALQEGYSVAIVARKAEYLSNLVDEVTAAGGEIIALPIEAYNYQTIAKVFEDVGKKWPQGRLKFALWNTSQWSNIPFLGTDEKAIQTSVDINIVAAFAFAPQVTRAFLAPARNGDATGGTLLVTGATSALRGAAKFGAFAAGKHGLRALTHAREYAPQGIHAAFVVIDGTIATPKIKSMFGNREGKTKGWLEDPSQALRPESIAKAYAYLHKQDRSAWTLEMDLRPSAEHF